MTRPELTYEEFCELHFEFRWRMTGDWGAETVYVNDDCGIWKYVQTKRKVRGDIYSGWKDSVVSYFIDSDGCEFKSFEDLYVAYMEKVCGVEV
jgi:hypothetical protein